MTTSAPSGTTWNWACVFDSDMSADESGRSVCTGSPARGSGRRPTSTRPSTVQRLAGVEHDPPDRGRPAHERPAEPLPRGDAPRPVGVVRRRQRGRRGRRRWRGGTGTSRAAVRLTTGGGWSGTACSGGPGGRTSTTHEPVRRSCQPRRRPPGSATAVQASAAAPKPNVGSVASPSTAVRSSARGTPIGWPSSGDDPETHGGLPRRDTPARRAGPPRRRRARGRRRPARRGRAASAPRGGTTRRHRRPRPRTRLQPSSRSRTNA